jgi:hypothetical protein
MTAMARRDWKRDPGVWVAAVVIGVLVVGGYAKGGSFGGGGDDEYVDSGATSAGAQDACQDRVKDLLKSPATAKFSDVAAVPQGAGTWRVTGSVDSENSFGALLRSSFSCMAESDDGELWTTSRAVVS